MLALISNSTIISTVVPDGWLTLPNGDKISPAVHGWSAGRYRLAEIQPAEAVPDGKEVIATDVELISGNPVYVNTLQDIVTADDEISRRQFFQGLEKAGKIPKAEALAAVQTGAIPAVMQTVIDAIPDEDARFNAAMLVAGAVSFFRGNALVSTFAASQGMTTEEVSEFWALCKSL